MMKFHFFCYITAIVLVKLNSIYSVMFWHVTTTAYLKEKEPNYHVHRYICSIPCKHGNWGHVILPKNTHKILSKCIRKTFNFPLWNILRTYQAMHNHLDDHVKPYLVICQRHATAIWKHLQKYHFSHCIYCVHHILIAYII